MAKNSILSSPRLEELKKKKKKDTRYKIFLYTFFLIAVFIGLSYGSQNTKININNIEIDGNKVIETKSIKEIVNTELEGKYMWIFPKTNFLIYPKRSIKNALNEKYKRLKDISIDIQDLTTMKISLLERMAVYTWCGADPLPDDIDDNEIKCYLLDNEGFIFDEAPYFSADVYTRFYGTKNVNMDNPVGSNFSKDIFNKLTSLKKSLEDINLKIQSFHLPENGDIKMFLPPKSSKNKPYIIFKADVDFDKVGENLQASLNTDPLQTDFRDKYNSLLYIDLRFNNKVYFKFE